MDYSAPFIIAILANRESIESFLESTTAVLTPSQYSTTSKEQSDFTQQEGHTLWNTGNKTSHVPSKGGLRENLVIWMADIDRARSTLTQEEDEALLGRVARKAGRPSSYQTELSEQALTKLVEFLNEDVECAL